MRSRVVGQVALGVKGFAAVCALVGSQFQVIPLHVNLAVPFRLELSVALLTLKKSLFPAGHVASFFTMDLFAMASQRALPAEFEATGVALDSVRSVVETHVLLETVQTFKRYVRANVTHVQAVLLPLWYIGKARSLLWYRLDSQH